jgi:hypothetical protein
MRTNALEVSGIPDVCGSIDCEPAVGFRELNEILRTSRPDSIITCSERLLFFGNSELVGKLFSADRIRAISSYPLSATVFSNPESTVLHSFIEQALCEALCKNKPLFLRKKGRSYFAVVDHEAIQDPRLSPLKASVGFRTSLETIVGQVSGIVNTYWAEAVELKLDRRDGRWWLLIDPKIWVSPLARRAECVNFLRQKSLKRYNKQTYAVLDAWINLLCGSVGRGDNITAECFSKANFPARFELNTRTAYSRRGGPNG